MVFYSTFALAQLDSIQRLETVYLTDPKLKKFSEGYQLQEISDSTLERTTYSLTNTLRNNSTIYFRENGYGMVSSASFRGTNAAQTAVIWNGIPINSSLTGQTDFNTIAPNAFDELTIKSGGGGAAFGSGAVGGSIHLNNSVEFVEQQTSEVRLGYGSFDTFFGNFKLRKSAENWYMDLAAQAISSENNYEYLEQDRLNENGAFKNANISFNSGWKWKQHTVSFHSNYFKADRNLSGTLTAPSEENYKDETTRNLITWNFRKGNWNHLTKVAHLYERYQYLPNKENELYFQGKARTTITNYQLDHHISEKIKLTGLLDYTHIEGEGSNIGRNSRNTMAAVLLGKHELSSKFTYGFHLRQEFLNDFQNPLLFGLDAKYRISSTYHLSVNASRNYRIPAFNDLFWNAGGNMSLQPENSYQADIGNDFHFGKFNATIRGFYIASTDLIKWQPNAQGIWSPVNIAETENYGWEFSGTFQHHIKEHRFTADLNYAYTKAIDKERDKQLIYVPFHKLTGILKYSYKNTALSFQTLTNGEVFTTTDNRGTLAGYTVANLGGEYTVYINKHPLLIGGAVNNLFNRYYENVAFRPMPNRNYTLFINFKF